MKDNAWAQDEEAWSAKAEAREEQRFQEQVAEEKELQAKKRAAASQRAPQGAQRVTPHQQHQQAASDDGLKKLFLAAGLGLGVWWLWKAIEEE